MSNPRTKKYIQQLHHVADKFHDEWPAEKYIDKDSQKKIAQYAILIMRDSKSWLDKPFSGAWLDKDPLADCPFVMFTSIKGNTPDARSQESYFDNIKLLGTEALALFKSDLSDDALLKSEAIQKVLNDDKLRLEFCYCGIPHYHLNGRSAAELWNDDYARFNARWKKET